MRQKAEAEVSTVSDTSELLQPFIRRLEQFSAGGTTEIPVIQVRGLDWEHWEHWPVSVPPHTRVSWNRVCVTKILPKRVLPER